MELKYKLISKENLPVEARISFAISDEAFYCWRMKEYLLINSQAPHLETVLDAMRTWWQYEIIDEDSDYDIDAAYKIILSHWSKQGADQAWADYKRALDNNRKEREEAWALEQLNQLGGQRGIAILDSMEYDGSSLFDALYNVTKKQLGRERGWREFVRVAYLYAYQSGMEAARRISS